MHNYHFQIISIIDKLNEIKNKKTRIYILKDIFSFFMFVKNVKK